MTIEQRLAEIIRASTSTRCPPPSTSTSTRRHPRRPGPSPARRPTHPTPRIRRHHPRHPATPVPRNPRTDHQPEQPDHRPPRPPRLLTRPPPRRPPRRHHRPLVEQPPPPLRVHLTQDRPGQVHSTQPVADRWQDGARARGGPARRPRGPRRSKPDNQDCRAACPVSRPTSERSRLSRACRCCGRHRTPRRSAAGAVLPIGARWLEHSGPA